MIRAVLPLALTLQAAAQDLTERFVIPDGLEVSLWAESPMLYNPTAIDVDASGRVWVAEGVNYRRWGGRNPGHQHPEGDRVVVLEDTDGDGSADRSTVFVQDSDLVAPLGICVLGNQVFVSNSPDIYVYTDVDGDLRADKREVFLTGFGGFDHDHGLHSVVAGDDGWLYIAAGNAGPHVVTGSDGFTVRSSSIYKGGSPYNGENAPGMRSDDGRVWTGGIMLKVRPDGTGLQVVAHNFRNQYEIARDSLGFLFTSDNDDDGNRSCRTAWVVEGGNYGYFSADGSRSWRLDRRPEQETTAAHWHAEDPGVMTTWTINGAGGPTGVAVYETEFLDGEMSPFDGAVLNCDAGAGVVYAHMPRRRASEITLETTVFLGRSSTSGREQSDGQGTWFRPSDVVVSTDGSVMVADWYDPGVGGHGMGDRETYGRILRVAPKGAGTAPVKLTYRDATAEEIAADERLSRPESPLLNALCSPAVSVRDRARKELLARGDDAFEALHDLAGDPSPRIAARAVEVLARLSDRGRDFVDQVTRHPIAELRLVAYRALADVGDERAPLLRRRLARDVSPLVRAAIAREYRDIPVDQALDELVGLSLLYEGEDRTYLESIGMGADGKESALFSRLAELHEQGALDEARFLELTWRLHPPEAVELFANIASDAARPTEQRRSLIDALAFIPTRDAADAMFALAHVGPADLHGYARNWLEMRAGNDWRAFGLVRSEGAAIANATKVFSSSVLRSGWIDIDVPVAGASTVWLVVTDGGDGHGCDWADWIAPRFVMEDGTDVSLAAQGWLEATTGWGDASINRNANGGPLRIGDDVFEEGIGVHAESRVAFEVPDGARRLVTQAGVDHGGSSQGCGNTVRFEIWTNAKVDRSEVIALRQRVTDAPTERERTDAARELAADAEGGLYLLELAREGRLDDGLRASVAKAMFSNPDLAVRALASAHFPRPGADHLPSVEELLGLEGSPSRGAEVFFSDKAQCSACHAYDGEGMDIGPDLTAIRQKLGRPEILDAVLNPSAAIAFGYDSYVVRTTDGIILSGFLLADGEDMILRDSAGERHVIPSDEVDARRRQELSVMPEGVALGLSGQEIADLVAFLAAEPDKEPVFGPPIELFDGETFTGWTHHLSNDSFTRDQVWSIEDGVLKCTGKPSGYVRTTGVYDNFELTLEWRFDPARGAGNSGVLMRRVGPDKVWPKSIEAQLWSRNAGDIWNIDRFPMVVDSSRTSGRHTRKMMPSNERPLGEWNHYRIVLNGGELTLEVNGLLQNTASWCEEVAGEICLQSEGAYIEFRNIVLRPIID